MYEERPSSLTNFDGQLLFFALRRCSTGAVNRHYWTVGEGDVDKRTLTGSRKSGTTGAVTPMTTTATMKKITIGDETTTVITEKITRGDEKITVTTGRITSEGETIKTTRIRIHTKIAMTRANEKEEEEEEEEEEEKSTSIRISSGRTRSTVS